MGSVTKGFGVGIPPQNQAVIPSSIDLWVGAVHIGFVSSIASSHQRPIERVRHIEFPDPGRTVEMVSKPEEISLSVQGFALYNQGLFGRRTTMNRLLGLRGLTMATLHEQQIPFMMVQVAQHPMPTVLGDDLGGRSETADLRNLSRVGLGLGDHKTLYWDCMLTSYSAPVNITQATVVETATVEVSYVESGDTLVTSTSLL